MKNLFFLLSASLVVIAVACTGEDGATEMIDELIDDNRGRAAGFLRAGFHDCITATKSKSGSGCNGSLRLREELRFSGNARIDRTIAILRRVQRESCMSWADLLQLGVERAMVKTGGPEVSLGRGRSDANSADDDDLPNENSSYNTLLAYFNKRGFTSREMVVAQVGGHSIGRFRGRRFSSNPNRFDNLYAVNLLDIAEGGNGLRRHNELDSDLQMIAKNQGLLWIKFYADSTETAGGSTRGRDRLYRDFRKYLVKQAKLSDDTVEE